MSDRATIAEIRIERLERQRDKYVLKCAEAYRHLQYVLKDNYNLKDGYPIRPELRDAIEKLFNK